MSVKKNKQHMCSKQQHTYKSEIKLSFSKKSKYITKNLKIDLMTKKKCLEMFQFFYQHACFFFKKKKGNKSFHQSLFFFFFFLLFWYVYSTNCSVRVNDLAIRDVNSSSYKETILDSQDGFEPTQSVYTWCAQDDAKRRDIFASFCLLPQPGEEDGFVKDMCSLQRTQENIPDSLFERLLRGDVTSLDQMPSIWESAQVSNQILKSRWFPALNGLVSDGGPSQGRLGLSVVENFSTMCASSEAKRFFATRSGEVFYSDPFHGVVRGATFDDNSTTNVNIRQKIKGVDNFVQNVTCNADGSVCVAWFSDAVWLFARNTWQKWKFSIDDTTVRAQNVKLWMVASNTTRIAIFTASTKEWKIDILEFSSTSFTPLTLVTFGQRIEPKPEKNEVRLGFMALSSDHTTLLVSTFDTVGPLETSALDTMHVHSFDLKQIKGKNAASYNKWICVAPEFSSALLPTIDASRDNTVEYTAALASSWSSATSPDGAATQAMLLLVSFHGFLFNVLFYEESSSSPLITFHNGISTARRTHPIQLFQSLYHTHILVPFKSKLFTDLTMRNTLVTDNLPISLTNDNVVSRPFAVSADGQDIWLFWNNGQLYRLHRGAADTAESQWEHKWTSNFNVLSARKTRISDFGDLTRLNPDVYVPGLKWYLGIKTTSSDFVSSASTYPIEVARSLHGMFRYAITGVQDLVSTNQTGGGGLLPCFPYAVGELQRVSEFAFANEQRQTVHLHVDSNVSFGRINMTEDFWQSNTHDRVSVGFDDFNRTRVMQWNNNNTQQPTVVSANGLYILYGNHNSYRMRLVFNPFNSERFAVFCKNSTERLGRALDAQSTMCWNMLKVAPDEKTGEPNGQFLDFRCSCIGGPRYFAMIAPRNENEPVGILAPLGQNLPCVAKECSSGFDNVSDAITNVRQYYLDRCGNRAFSICQETFVVGSNVSAVNSEFVFLQDCSVNKGVSKCANSKECDIGSICVNGRCVPQCTKHTDCARLFGNSVNMSCSAGHCELSKQKPDSKLDLPVILAASTFLVFLVLLLLFVSFRAKMRFSQTEFRKSLVRPTVSVSVPSAP